MQHSTVKKEGGEQAQAGPVAQDGAREPRSKKSASAFRTISEVADDLGVQQHVLRFWETKFSQIRPLKRGGGRRYYRPEDVALLKSIHNLLYTEGYTIKGVQKLLKEQGKNKVVQNNRPSSQPQGEAGPRLAKQHKTALESMLGELRELRRMIKT
jgi:DNA-binding transcriptional MerR regulator